jgi:hypothetical protein
MATAGLLTGAIATAVASTLPQISVISVGSNLIGAAQTLPQLNILSSGSNAVAGIINPPSLNGLLILKPTISTVDTACSSVVITDSTGDYNGTTNTWGYNPESAGFDPNRPKRSEVDLYVGWINYDATGSFWTYAFEQDPSLIPYEITVTGIPEGVNEIYLIAVPLNTVLTNYEEQNLPYIYAFTAGWYGGSCPGIGIYCIALSRMVSLLRRYNDDTIHEECEFLPFLKAQMLEVSFVSNLRDFAFINAVVSYTTWVNYLDQVKKDCDC